MASYALVMHTSWLWRGFRGRGSFLPYVLFFFITAKETIGKLSLPVRWNPGGNLPTFATSWERRAVGERRGYAQRAWIAVRCAVGLLSDLFDPFEFQQSFSLHLNRRRFKSGQGFRRSLNLLPKVQGPWAMYRFLAPAWLAIRPAWLAIRGIAVCSLQFASIRVGRTLLPPITPLL